MKYKFESRHMYVRGEFYEFRDEYRSLTGFERKRTMKEKAPMGLRLFRDRRRGEGSFKHKISEAVRRSSREQSVE